MAYLNGSSVESFGHGGDSPSFNDGDREAKLQRVHVYNGATCIEGIECEYRDGSRSGVHGRETPGSSVFELSEDEQIIVLHIWEFAAIHGLRFTTTKGRVSPVYGTTGGSPWVVNSQSPNGLRPLAGFSGQSEGLLRSIRPLWSDHTFINKDFVLVDGSAGCADGHEFNNLDTVADPLKASLTAIKMWPQGTIRALQCQWNGKDEIWSTLAGQKFGDGELFKLLPNERIIRINGRAGAEIDGLQFVTNHRVSKWYGNQNGGSPFTFTAPKTGDSITSDIQMCLLGFRGHAASSVFGLAPIWAADCPVKYTLDITHFDSSFKNGTKKANEATRVQHIRENNGSEKLKSTFTFSTEATKSTKVTLSKDFKFLLGGKVSLEVTAKGKVGLPVVAEGELSVKAGVQVSTQGEWTTTNTDETVSEKKIKVEFADEVTIPPHTKMIGTAVAFDSAVTNEPWTGAITVTYMSGATKVMPTNGTFDSVTVVDFLASYSEQPL